MATSSMPSNMGQPCDICGDIGYAKDITICSKCNKSREHIYCMNPTLFNVPKSWHCEACRGHNIYHHNSGHSGGPKRYLEEMVQDTSKRQKTGAMRTVSFQVPDGSKTIGSPSGKPARRLLSRNFVPKKVESGKVKFLPVEDLCASSFGTKRKPSCIQGGSSSLMGSPSTNHRPNSKRTLVSLDSSLKPLTEKPHAHKSAGHLKPVMVGRTNTSTLQKQDVKLSQPLHGLKSPSQFACKSPTSENLKGVPGLTMRNRRHIDEAYRSLPNHNGPAVFGVQEKCEVNSLLSKGNVCKEEPVDTVVPCDGAGTSNSKSLFKFGKEDIPNPPAGSASWKGSFKILDFPNELCGGFQAYPPGKVSRKAYLVSKQMPEVLQFTLQPRCKMWPKTFHTDSPSGFDIALYFWADDLCRSRVKYNHLLELMEKQDLSMKSCLDGVELFIFTSKQLPIESQRMNMQFYLWGVFHSTKGQPSSVDKKRQQHAVMKSGQFDDCDSPPGFSGPVNSNAAGKCPIANSIMNLSPVGHQVDASPGFSNSTKLEERDSSSMPHMNMSTIAHEVDAPAFSNSIKLEKWDSSSKSPLMNVSPIAHEVDDPPGFSKSIKLEERDSSSKSALNVIPVAHEMDSPPGFSKSTKLKEGGSSSKSIMNVSPVAHEVDSPPGFSNSTKLKERDSSSKSAMNVSPVAHKVDSRPGFSNSTKLKEREFSSKVTAHCPSWDSVATLSTEKNGCGSTWSPVRANQVTSHWPSWDSVTTLSTEKNGCNSPWSPVGAKQATSHWPSWDSVTTLSTEKNGCNSSWSSVGAKQDTSQWPSWDSVTTLSTEKNGCNSSWSSIGAKQDTSQWPSWHSVTTLSTEKNGYNSPFCPVRANQGTARWPSWDSVTTLSTEKNGSNSPLCPIRAHESNCSDSGTKVGEVEHIAKNEVWDNSKVPNGWHSEKLAHREQKKQYSKSPSYDFHPEGGSRRSSGRHDEKRVVGEEKKRLPRSPSYEFHLNGDSQKSNRRHDEELVHRENMKRFSRSPSYDFYSRGDYRKSSGRHNERSSRREEKKRSPSYDFHSRGDYRKSSRRHKERSGRREERKRYSRSPSHDFHSKGDSKKSNRRHDEEHARREQKKEFSRSPSYDFHSGADSRKFSGRHEEELVDRDQKKHYRRPPSYNFHSDVVRVERKSTNALEVPSTSSKKCLQLTCEQSSSGNAEVLAPIM